MGTQPKRKPWTGFHSSALWESGSTTWPTFHAFLSLCFFLVEVVASRVTGSLLLLSSAFHTLGGALALATVSADRWTAAKGCCVDRNTFGWTRAKVVGRLASAVFLTSLCLALVPEALRRMAAPRAVEHMLVLVGIGAMGIPLHLARAGLLERQARDPNARRCCNGRKVAQEGTSAQEMEDLLGNEPSTNGQPWTADPSLATSTEKPGQLYLAWMLACLGPLTVSLCSLISHLLVEETPCPSRGPCRSHCPKSMCQAWDAPEMLQDLGPPCWLLYLDPGLALALTVVLLWLAWPGMRDSALVLLQAVPEELDLNLLEIHLLATEGVVAVTALHVWQLDGFGSLVATAHVCCRDVAGYEAVILRVQQVFCEHGIHAVTVQPVLSECPGGGGCHGKCDAASCEGCPSTSSAEVMEYETTV